MKFLKINRRTFLTVLISLLSLQETAGQNSHSSKEKYPRKYKYQEVVNYFKNKHDSIGVISAMFLVRNLETHGTIDRKNGSYIADTFQISPKYLIRSIEQSLIFSRLYLSTGELKIEHFLEYVLPYRIAYENVTDWKFECRKRYSHLLRPTPGLSLSDRAEIIIKSINRKLIGSFRYSTNHLDANIQSWRDLITTRSGDCWAMTNTITYPLRSLGLPVSIDFAPGWANANGLSHAWNVFLSNNSKMIFFLGFEGSPPAYHPFRIYRSLYRKPAKVFRRSFSPGIKCLRSYIRNPEDIPRQLDFDHALDVTNKYVKTKNVKIRHSLTEENCILYLSSFSSGKWEPKFWSRRTNGYFMFEQMGIEGIYVVSEHRNNITHPIGYPFSIHQDRPKIYKANKHQKIAINVKSIRSVESAALALYGIQTSEHDFYKKMEDVYSRSSGTLPVEGVEYTLFYWDDGWNLAGKCYKEKNKELIFRNIPSNSIYRLEFKGSANTSRIFTYTNLAQRWW